MLLYKDVFTNEDVFTDVFKVDTIDDMYYRIHGKYIVEKYGIDEALIGGNKSAETENAHVADDDSSNQKLIPDIISANKLQEVPSISSKDDYKAAIKDYITRLVKHVAEKDKERAEFLKANLKDKFVLPMLKKYKKLRIYACDGDGFDLVGGLIHFEQDATDGSEKCDTNCHIIVLKDSVYEEKC